MAEFEIPISGRPERFNITLNNRAYVMRLHYADAIGAGWMLDIFDGSANPLVCGIALLPGHDLLGQYGYLGIGGADTALRLVSSGDDDTPPTFSNLSSYRLIFSSGA